MLSSESMTTGLTVVEPMSIPALKVTMVQGNVEALIDIVACAQEFTPKDDTFRLRSSSHLLHYSCPRHPVTKSSTILGRRSYDFYEFRSIFTSDNSLTKNIQINQID